MMYPFQARIPLDHVKVLVANIRSGEFSRGDNLILVGAISGETGALLKQGFLGTAIFAESDCEDLEICCDKIEEMFAAENHAAVAAANGAETKFDPTLWIPLILKLIELFLSRRG